ncbi:MAG: hypothetical protein GTO14_01315 [Anaerolineales bacterium]|nr:hypothetical protein [Anaerolineales bacterium]
MESFGVAALLLIITVGYSLGSVTAASRGSTPSPTLLDLSIVSALCAIALISRPMLGKWGAIGVWLLGAFLIGASRILLSKTGTHAQETRTIRGGRGPLWRKLWGAWKVLAVEMGNYQGRMLLAFFYFIVVTPWGILFRFLSDPLNTHPPPIPSFWLERVDHTSKLEDAGRQF